MERSQSKTLEIKGLKTHFFTKRGVVPAVDGIDIEIGKGEVVGVVGESGCGKSITAMQNQLLGAYTESSPETLVSLERINRLDDMLQEILIKQGVIPIPQGDTQVSQNGIGAQGPVNAPSSVDALPNAMPNNLGTPPVSANDKDQWGNV